jgi:hypothetical protein
MEHLVAFLHDAIWALAIILVLAVIGFISIIRWIVGLFRKGEQEVETGVRNVEESVHRH